MHRLQKEMCAAMRLGIVQNDFKFHMLAMIFSEPVAIINDNDVTDHFVCLYDSDLDKPVCRQIIKVPLVPEFTENLIVSLFSVDSP